MIGPAAEGWPVFPTYYALQLLLQHDRARLAGRAGRAVGGRTTGRSDKAPIRPRRSSWPTRAHGGELTVMGLDTHGRDLNTVPPRSPQYSIGGLPADTSFNLALWNAAGERREHACRHGQVRCRGRRPLRGAVARRVLADHRARFLSRERSPGRGGRSGDGSELAAALELANHVAAANRAGLDDLRVQAP